MLKTANPFFSIWSPHRESHAVLAWKSLLGFRLEPWIWCDDSSQAAWWLLDASMGVPQDLTLALRHSPEKKGVLLARDFVQVPDPIWQFFKTPLQTGRINQWLDHLLRSKDLLGQADPSMAKKTPLPNLQGQYLQLQRWPNLTRYGESSLSFTQVCAHMLEGTVASHTVLNSAVYAQDGMEQFLHDCWADGILEVHTAARVSKLPMPPKSALEVDVLVALQRSKALLKRLWERFL